MDRNSIYYRQVQLLTAALPYVARETCFALKGGTAINLFYLPMPRLSVDIDLTYLPIEALRAEPRPHGVEKLSGQEKYRIRQGVYRILSEIRNNELVVVVVNIGHRRDVYRIR